MILEILPVINKIDHYRAAVSERVRQEIEDVIPGIRQVKLLASAKAGIGIEDILEQISWNMFQHQVET